MADMGYFIMTDISGYTEYLTGSEMDHANEILQSLFDAQSKTVRHPFMISGFRGDAIFMYMLERNFVQSHRFPPFEKGTRARIYLTKPVENSSDEVRQLLQGAMDSGYAGSRSFIEHEITSGKITAN